MNNQERDFRSEIFKLLEQLQVYGYSTQAEVEKAAHYSPKSITQSLSRGGTEDMVFRLTELLRREREAADNPSVQMLELVKEMKVKVDSIFLFMAEMMTNNTKSGAVTMPKAQVEQMLKDVVELYNIKNRK